LVLVTAAACGSNLAEWTKAAGRLPSMILGAQLL
jgi:hypothetical protein